MRSAWVALALLLIYILLVFLVFRFLDIVLWYQHGVPSTQVVNPLLLSVRQLKHLLELRGISYTGYVEKKELAQLVEASADVIQGEVEEMNEVNLKDKERLSSSPSASHFTGAPHFYEQVEDTKDSVWLVQVIPTTKTDPLLDDYTWTVVRNMVAPFAIRTGIFHCPLDHRMCNSKGWTQPLLLLAMPRGTKPKDKVVMRTCQLTKPNAILEWLSEQLSLRVRKVPNLETLEKEWLQSKSNNSSTENNIGVKVLLLTHLLHPPLFLAALSIKFTGRITFGIFTVKKEDTNKIGRVPIYLIITPDKTIVYGRRKMEHFNLKSMNAFLKAVQPEMNDFFLFSLILVNMFAVFQFLQISTDSWWKILATSLWTIVLCNLLLFASWLILVGALRWPLTSSLCNWCLYVVRRIALTETGSLIRSDWLRLLKSTWIFICSLFTFGIIASRKLPPNLEEPGATSWWEIDCLFRPQSSIVNGPGTISLDPETGVLIERLAVPALWLEPSLSHEYASLLPIHKYRPPPKRIIKKDSPEALQTVMDSSDDNVINQLSKKDIIFDSKEITECAICLDKYRSGVLLCTLPCSHNYHHKCIFTWLSRDNHHCPICRWPAYKSKI